MTTIRVKAEKGQRNALYTQLLRTDRIVDVKFAPQESKWDIVIEVQADGPEAVADFLDFLTTRVSGVANAEIKPPE